MSRRKSLILITLLIVSVATISFLKLGSAYQKYSYHGIRYGKKAPDFELINQDNEPTTLSQFKGDFILIAFGYTSCPDICPTTLSRLNRVVGGVGNLKDYVKVMFITVDPDRDNPERLKKYMTYFNNDFVGLTGSTDNIKNVAESYSAFYEKEETDSSAGYLMSHTSSVYLVDKKGNLTFVYPYSQLKPDNIAEDIIHLDKALAKNN